MVSTNDHVVMNHQNQTRTNGIWGHVRYTTSPSWSLAHLPSTHTSFVDLQPLTSPLCDLVMRTWWYISIFYHPTLTYQVDPTAIWHPHPQNQPPKSPNGKNENFKSWMVKDISFCGSKANWEKSWIVKKWTFFLGGVISRVQNSQRHFPTDLVSNEGQRSCYSSKKKTQQSKQLV
jgi:hypothetical protein